MPDQTEALPAAPPVHSETIQRILDARKPHRDKVRVQFAQMTKLREKLKAIEELAPKLVVLAQPSDGLQETSSKKQGQASTSLAPLLERLDKQLELLKFLDYRFKRETLNVAVVGKKREGKSELLGRMSGLSQEIIPRRDSTEPCTGARSILLHKEGADVMGKVYFHDEASMLEVIHLYWKGLNLPPPPPITLKAFLNMASVSIPALPEEIKDGTLIEYHKSLRKYHHFLKQLWTKYGGHIPEDINASQIKEFVTQPLGNSNDAEIYERLPAEEFKFLVVKKVEIFCEFPGQNKDVEGLGLIDLPGLGELTLGGPERVRETLEKEADVLLFVYRPPKQKIISDPENQETYKVCRTALDQYLPLKEWAYLVINQQVRNGLDNTNEAKDSQKYVEDQKTSPEPTMLYRQDVICDVFESKDVKDKILDPMLADIMNRIGSLDAQFAQSCWQGIAQLQRDIETELSRVSQILNISPSAQIETLSMKKFVTVWKDIREAMTLLKKELEAKADKPDAQFQQLVKDLLGKLRVELTFLSDKTAASELDIEDAVGIPFDRERHQLRAQITRHLRILDQELLEAVDAARAKVLEIFLDKGKLRELLPNASLQNLARLMENYPQIREAINYLDDFHLPARSVIGYKIWPALAELEPRKQKYPDTLDMDGTKFVDNLDEAVKKITSRLESGLKVAAEVGKSSPTNRPSSAQERHYQNYGASARLDVSTPDMDSLASDYSIPNRCAYAIVAEFRDMVIFDLEAEHQWRAFYGDIKAKVWPADFKSFADTRQLQQDLLNLISEARSLNQTIVGGVA